MKGERGYGTLVYVQYVCEGVSSPAWYEGMGMCL